MTRYRTIVVDPPWEYPEGFVAGHGPHKQDRERGVSGGRMRKVESPYACLSLNEIAALPVPDLAAADSRLFLWVTMRYLPAAFTLVVGWGFEYRQLLVWDKTPNIPPFGGSVAPNAAEFLIVAVRGKPARTGRWSTSVLRARKPRTSHSVKPDVFLDLVETVSPGPYAELFSRRARLGWDYPIGDQALGGVAA